MTKEEAILKLNSLPKTSLSDVEDSHLVADGILLDVLSENGFNEVVETYLKVRDEIGFWYA